MDFRISVRGVKGRKEKREMDRDERKISKGQKRIVERICKLEPQEFMGICKILGVKIYEEIDKGEEKEKLNVEARPAEKLIEEVIEKVVELNRAQRRNLDKLLKAATKGEK